MFQDDYGKNEYHIAARPPDQAGSSVQNLLINVEKRKLLFIL
jgi:hypothetical protein